MLCDKQHPNVGSSAAIEVVGGTLVTTTSASVDLKGLGSDIDGGPIASITWDLNDDGIFPRKVWRLVSYRCG